jgi:predicted transcriptional regulator
VTTTVRVSDETHARLAALSAATGRRMQAIVDDAIAAYEASEFWKAFTDRYGELTGDPQRWAEVQDEREHEAPALTDDLG